jgi:hypothetical protein
MVHRRFERVIGVSILLDRTLNTDGAGCGHISLRGYNNMLQIDVTCDKAAMADRRWFQVDFHALS